MSKRKQFTIEEKANVIFRLKKGEKNSDIANELGVGHSTISNIWKARDEIEQEFQNEKLSVKKLRNCTHTDLDNVLLRWFKNQRNLCIPINGPILQQKANELAEGLGKHNFNCSTGWIQRFRARHNIVFSTISGESNSVNTEITQNWLEKVWPKLREGYTDDQIYNADETGLFYRMLPNRTLKFKGEKCSGGKMSKERLTVLVSASMTGKKMKLIIIGKSRNPRCFKNINSDCLPVTYESNSKAWMAAELWSKILLNWDLELGRKKEKILLLVDNCPAHCTVALRNIKLVFLPSNCTSVFQPMDQGVIKCMKTYFRKSLVLNMINNIENKIEANISVLDGILMIFKAWGKVSEITRRNCFRHAGFNNAIPQQTVQGEQEEDISFPNINEYVNFDNDVLTSEPLSDQEIISSLINQPGEPEEDDNSEETDTPDGDLSINAVFNAAKMLANYMALNNVSPKINFEELEKK
ncbi:tigger transposable element-derived protein 4-like [Metopolophium dirhodum]|uniref:tigger transposable element-derived protein 4-like n=1 Tax=Metopolophium dirhodum TaxID=44670 RepID=UPI00298FE13F|nr:tigger transposable element-derived protein 4-like [Metopolophium dirhodum]